MRWRAHELWTARQFRACGRMSVAEIEELYDETVAALIEKGDAYDSVEHLRAALHRGIKLRALRLHRDRHTRSRLLSAAAPVIESAGQDAAWWAQPERATIAREDDMIVSEFIAELDQLERRVFALVADGRSWRAIATALGLPETQARTLTRACERKRVRFLSLYSTGRLCGYRSATIGGLLAGRIDGELAFGKAVAHLRHCRECQARHRTDAARLRAMFDSRALSVLAPAPVLVGSHGSLVGLHSAALRVGRWFQRGNPASGVRERALEIVGGGGVGAKVAVGLAGVALLAGGAVEAHPPHSRSGHGKQARSSGGVAAHRLPVARSDTRVRAATPARRGRPGARLPLPGQQHTPGGFSYLGVTHPAAVQRRSPPVLTQHGGTPFAP